MVDEITAEGLAVMIARDRRRRRQEVDVDRDRALVEAKPIMQPFGDRSKVVIEPMLTDQWFVDTAKIVGPALDAVREGDVKIMPESAKRSITTGWRTSSPGASRASFGGGIRFRFGMGSTVGGFRTTKARRAGMSNWSA